MYLTFKLPQLLRNKQFMAKDFQNKMDIERQETLEFSIIMKIKIR